MIQFEIEKPIDWNAALKSVEFSKNWNNKLKCPYFTTIRKYTAKYKIGEAYNIFLSGRFLYEAVLKSMRYVVLDEMDSFTAYCDTGYSPAETTAMLKKMYPDWETQKFALFLFGRRESQKTN